MATANDTVYVSIIAKTSEAIQGMEKFAKSVASTYLSWKTFKTLVVDSFKEFMKAEDAQTRLSAAIRITGQQATASVRVLASYAKELQNLTNYEEEATMSAMGLLMQLGGLTQEGVKKTIPLLQDFAATFNMDLTQAAELFGKTIGSSTNALSRYGITLKEGLSPQEKMVSILDQLQNKMGGFAEEVANTTSGKLKAMKIQVDELKESFGGLLAQIMQTNAAKTFMDDLKNGAEQFAWILGGWKVKIEDVSKYTKQGMVEYNEQLNKSRLYFEKLLEHPLHARAAEQYKKEIAAIEARMADVNRMMQRGQYAAAPEGAPAPGTLTTGTGSPVITELTEEQKEAQKMRDMWVELRKQAILYQKEVQNNRDMSVDTAEVYEHINGQLKSYEEIISATGVIAGNMGDISKAAESTAEDLEKARQEASSKAWENLADNFKSIAKQLASTAVISFFSALGEAAAGTQSMADAMRNMISQMLSSLGTMMVEAGLQLIIYNAYNPVLVAVGIGLMAAGGLAVMGGSYLGAKGKEEGTELPHMAAGGIVNRPTLALIGESGPEAVVPLGRGGAGGVTINVQGSIWQTEDLAREVAGAMGRW